MLFFAPACIYRFLTKAIISILCICLFFVEPEYDLHFDIGETDTLTSEKPGLTLEGLASQSVEQLNVCEQIGNNPCARFCLLPSPTQQVHASTMTQLEDGKMIIAWFGGQREGASDVVIYGSLYSPAEGWSAPAVLVDRFRLQRDLGVSIRKLGNPLLHFQDGRLHLFVVSVSYGGWSGSTINHSYSDDSGRTWSRFHRLQLSPLFNVSNLIRNTPIALSDGKMGLPIYHELIKKYSEWLVLGRDGKIVSKTRIPSPYESLQPTFVPFGSQEAVALMRNGAEKGGKIGVARTRDAGASWQALPSLPIDNPNSGISLIRLSHDSFLLAGNGGKDRSTLNIWSNDGKDFQEWNLVFQVENTPGKEFSYPCLFQDKFGNIHLSYTWQRKKIKHWVFPCLP